ncbi:hypothetical protein MIB92_13975 [Aestuariirhabdus sp. Z084]|uniref:hypothetical protein n=1 Tax=Aestuariirhabdus haliotis TaxID=2918751 RepID=UPI00201B4244|nr:hypothetical protein [Aestuariirhabdus haliotis]MCL6416764.1 hypothetical protein [Aestuariirhabdus haliotis]MCL6420771.1 hypothetical protein [Aestuariirhabdus haliotis]
MTIQQLRYRSGSRLIEAINIRTYHSGYIAEIVIDNIPHTLNQTDSSQPLVFSSIRDIKSRLGNTYAGTVNLITDNGISQV